MSRYPKPALLDQLPPDFGVVEASAGTGKTYLLERMLVDLLLRGTPLERILVVTYTDKAALELRTRIRQMLERLLALDPDGDPVPEPAWTLLEPERALLAKALRGFDRATLSTIHGFCRKILVEAAFEGGSLFTQELTDGTALFERAYRDLLRTRFQDHPGAAQVFRDALAAGIGLERIRKLLAEAHGERGKLLPEPWDLGAVLARFDPAWTRNPAALKAAMDAKGIKGQTSAAAVKTLPVLAELLADLESPLLFPDGWKFEGLMNCCLQLDPGPGLELGTWLRATGGNRFPLENLLASALLPPIQARIRFLKATEGLYDYDDIILQVRGALAGPFADGLVARIRETFAVAIIDEFQDTDQIQWEIFRTLFLAPGQKLFVIGDPKQAIYGFRGGDLPTYDKAVGALLGGRSRAVLAENWRSTPAVIDAYNDLFTGVGPDGERFFRDPETYPPGSVVQCGNPGLRATTGAGAPLPPVSLLRIPKATGGEALRRQVAAVLAQEIKQTVEAGVTLHDPGHEDPDRRAQRLGFGDVRVLVGNGVEGQIMARALARIGVPCVAFKQKGLLKTDEAMDLLEVLQAVELPHDPGRRARALLTPFFGFRLGDLEGLAAMPEDHPAFRQLLAWRQLGRQRLFPQLLEAMLHGSGLIRRLRLDSGNERAMTNYLHLAELLAGSGGHGAADLEALVRRLTRWVEGRELPPGKEPEIQRLEGQDNAVQVMTMHASKGLEGGIVAVLSHSKGQLPTLYRFYDARQERCASFDAGHPDYAEAIAAEKAGEEERLIYVALTRAKVQLILPCYLEDKTDGSPIDPESPYRVVNRRLRGIALDPDWRPDLYARKDVELPEDPGARPLSVDLSGWTMPALAAPAAPDYAGARARSRPSFTTSYTQIEAVLQTRSNRPDAPPVVEEPDADEAGPARGNPLPRGSQTGQAIHELLELEDAPAAMAQDFPTWWQDPGRRLRVKEKLAEHGIPPRWEQLAAQMVHAGLNTPLPDFGGGDTPPDLQCGGTPPDLQCGGTPLGDHKHLLREMDFLARFLDTGDFLTGSMDAVYQRGGRIYFLDWKTNSLDDYGPGPLAAFAREHFQVQWKIYTRVLLEHMGILDEAGYRLRFGGIHYVFLRAQPPAVHSFRPDWAEVQGWARDLSELHEKVAHV